MLALAASCAHPAPPPPRHVRAPSPDVPDAGSSARVVRHRAPETAPPEFAEHAVARDVDGDGRDDLVRALPIASPAEWWPSAENFAPLVAHRLADGRYALDDEVTRAHLRALCPAPPGDRAIALEQQEGDHALPRACQALLIDGFCHRVWGAPLDAAIAAVRSVARRSGEEVFPTASVDAVIAALRTVPVPQELEAVDAPPLASVPVVPAAAAPEEPAAPAACAAANRANAVLLARASRPGVDLRVAFARDPLCVATPTGVWFIPLRMVQVPRSDDEEVRVFGALTWRPTVGPARAGQRLTFLLQGNYHVVRFSLLPGADYDGDGTPEVILRGEDRESEAGAHRTFTIQTLRAGEVQPYAPASGLENVEGVVDADRDGRPDLLLPSPWHRDGICGYMGSSIDGPTRLAHSLPDGTFSTADEVARAWMLSRCVREELGYIPALPAVLDVACARLHGASAETVIASLRARVPDDGTRFTEAFNDPCLSFPALASVALLPLPYAPTAGH